MKHVGLGSMLVFPWHDANRIAEQVSVVDHQSNGRMLPGMGRGLARAHGF
jgi:alkanesulfonate monooxygenase SsuD/methylene tetrahydromethanopterin reductase-like flavin-dependent oxidoreductase (luciferase family)